MMEDGMRMQTLTAFYYSRHTCGEGSGEGEWVVENVKEMIIEVLRAFPLYYIFAQSKCKIMVGKYGELAWLSRWHPKL